MLDLASFPTPQPGPLRLLDEIGRGGSSIVYLGQLRDPLGGSHQVAVKLADDRLLQREFELARDVSSGSEHLITCRGAADLAGRPVLLYDYVDGYTLAEIFRRRRATRDELAAIADALGNALSHLAVCGIVHRDLSPTNVFVDKTGRVLLGDLGHAIRVGEPCAENACGTPGYNSPEQLANSALGPPSDAYSLGKLLAHLACGLRSSPGAKLPRKLGPVGRVIARLLVRDQSKRLRADQIRPLLSPQDIYRGRGMLATYAGGRGQAPETQLAWKDPAALRRWQYLSAVSLTVTAILIALISIRSDEPARVRQLASEPMPDAQRSDGSPVLPVPASNSAHRGAVETATSRLASADRQVAAARDVRAVEPPVSRSATVQATSNREDTPTGARRSDHARYDQRLGHTAGPAPHSVNLEPLKNTLRDASTPIVTTKLPVDKDNRTKRQSKNPQSDADIPLNRLESHDYVDQFSAEGLMELVETGWGLHQLPMATLVVSPGEWRSGKLMLSYRMEGEFEVESAQGHVGGQKVNVDVVADRGRGRLTIDVSPTSRGARMILLMRVKGWDRALILEGLEVP
ncbi:MAG: hypothetical protein Tsb0020_28980 [Haliangiales bacterium]